MVTTRDEGLRFDNILVSYISNYLYISIYGDDEHRQKSLILPAKDIEVVGLNVKLQDEYELMSKLSSMAINYCIEICKTNKAINIPEALNSIKCNSYGTFDIDTEYMDNYLDTKERAMGYALVLHLWKKYGVPIIEYLSQIE